MSACGKFVARTGFLLGALLTLGGCASVASQQQAEHDALQSMRQELEALPTCCAEFSGYAPRLELPGKPDKFEIGDEAKVRLFASGKSRFIGFRLPDRSAPYPVEMMPIAKFHSSRAEVGSHFAPSVLLLDADFQPIGAEIEPELKDDPGRYLWRDGPYADVVIDPASGARYMVVFANPQSLGKDSYMSTVLVVGYSSIPVKYQRLAAPKGVIQIGEGKKQ